MGLATADLEKLLRCEKQPGTFLFLSKNLVIQKNPWYKNTHGWQQMLCPRREAQGEVKLYTRNRHERNLTCFDEYLQGKYDLISARTLDEDMRAPQWFCLYRMSPHPHLTSYRVT